MKDRLPHRGLLLATLLAGAACAPLAPGENTENPGTEPDNPNPTIPGSVARDCAIPADRRSTLPEAIARATEVACREAAAGTPIPSSERKEPTRESIRIVRELFSRCKPDPRNDPRGEDLWGGWFVRLDSTTHYLERAKANVELRTKGGLVISKSPLSDIGLSPNSLGYVPAFIAPNPKQRSMGAGLEFYLSGKGSQLDSARLDIAGPLVWKKVDNSPMEYRWDAKYAGIETATSASPNYNRIYGYGPRILSVQFSNNGERAIKGVGLFGFLLNGGELIDVLQGEAGSVDYGQSKVIRAASVSNTGRCAGSGDAGKGLELFWWTTFFTHTGMPVEKYETLRLPNS